MSHPTRAALLRQATEALAAADVPDPARDARLLLRWASGLEAAALSADLETPPNDLEAHRFAKAIGRRAARTPVSHITGTRAFWGRDFRVTPEVLDPRPETETLIAEALHRGPFRHVLDLGTGSGCILLTLLAEWPEATGLGTDTSDAALAVATSNADTLGIDRVTFANHDWWDGIDGAFDLIVSNPPYIAADEIPALSPEVREHEPRAALTPGGDGLAAYRAIATGAVSHLAPGGLLMVEIGPTQYYDVSAILAGARLLVHAEIPDLDQRSRVIVAGC
ncbi:MAG: peptide chain release factor N(5)-glutamine methyltransferase [Pseudomonadota bacterium]